MPSSAANGNPAFGQQQFGMGQEDQEDPFSGQQQQQQQQQYQGGDRDDQRVVSEEDLPHAQGSGEWGGMGNEDAEDPKAALAAAGLQQDAGTKGLGSGGSRRGGQAGGRK